ncbi:aldose epimerase family protein [Tamlana sp. 2_MG-2023]|uniref:aldose epimerase family protein n=1 Tax=unclassified Tamlana TaxID=2614803 RepID=UPI0026E4618F|nr:MULTISPECIES: aldose epimerase family protein [unclassified Tamlana]MDO6761325.1 aldose epimerase family protein [Tamlana sp. 2_MG-2023]MDO6791808.1 aldose epimerase family protein [Tamlana sp. 1_MG-2023]
MKTTKTNFGQLENQNIDLFTLTNDHGLEVKITNYGATITAISIPDSNGNPEIVTCGFNTLEGYFSDEYVNNSPYFGGTVGRYCSQIKNAEFPLNGELFKLAKNAGENNLHGGVKGFDKKIWKSFDVDIENASAIGMILLSEDLEEGFPGNVEVSVEFILDNQNELHINYSAVPDQDTPLSLTNHTYFNLSGFSESIEGHTAKVNTNRRLETDETGAATGKILNIEGQADDLRTEKQIGDVHEEMKDGFEHFYIIDSANSELKHAATISDPKTKRSLDVFTTEPCMLLYTGKYTSDALQRENGQKFGKYRGFCCETHRYPNGPNIEGSPRSITKADDVFQSTTVFKFKF